MKRFRAFRELGLLLLCAAMMLAVFVSPGFSALKYNPEDWDYLKERYIPGFSADDIDNNRYGVNCYRFVGAVLDSEDRGPLTGWGANHAYLTGHDTISDGQYLNSAHGGTGPTSADVKSVFTHALPGDVVQMYWYGTQHTALISGIEDTGVWYFQSHMRGYAVPHIDNDFFTWERLSELYSVSTTYGGLSIYRFTKGNLSLEGYYETTGEGHYSDPTDQTDYPVSDGVLRIVGEKESNEADWLRVSGTINFEQDSYVNSYLTMSPQILTWNKKELGIGDGHTLREWDVNNPIHIHLQSGRPVYYARDAHYYLTQIDSETIELRVVYKYCDLAVTLKKKSSIIVSAADGQKDASASRFTGFSSGTRAVGQNKAAVQNDTAQNPQDDEKE